MTAGSANNFPLSVIICPAIFPKRNRINRRIFSRLLAIKSNNGAIDDEKKRRKIYTLKGEKKRKENDYF